TFYVADTLNNRVLVWNNIPSSMGQLASFNLGQASGMTTTVTGNAAANLNAPMAVCSDGTHLYVADKNNHRVLVYNEPIAVNGQAAVDVLGQTGFGTSVSGSSVSQLNSPNAVYVDAAHLYVSDNGNNRVLIYNLPISTNQSAAVVIGQNGFGSGIANQGLSAPTSQTISNPYAVWGNSSANELYVADAGNNRVLIYNPIPSGNDAGASLVLGQAAMTLGGANQSFGSPSSNTLSF